MRPNLRTFRPPAALVYTISTGHSKSRRGDERFQRNTRGEVSRMLERLAIWASKSFARFEELRSEDGQALVEYALILALIAVVSIAALTALGTGVSTQLQAIATAISGA